MNRRHLAAFVVVLTGVTTGIASGAGKAAVPPPPTMPSASDFVSTIDNQYFPLEPGTTFVYRGTKDGLAAENITEVTRKTKTILGVRAIVVFDRAFIEGQLEEKTFDWYAQDKRGNVWYLGEDSFDLVDGKWVRSDGSWEAGVDGAKAGIVMEAHPAVGDVYRQEYYAGHAEDVAEVLSTAESVTVAYGSFSNVLVTKDWTPLDRHQIEHKYFASGVGQVKSSMVKGGSEEMELVSVVKGK